MATYRKPALTYDQQIALLESRGLQITDKATVNPKTKFRERFMKLLEEYPIVNTHFMGFPKDWEKHPLWKVK